MPQSPDPEREDWGTRVPYVPPALYGVPNSKEGAAAPQTVAFAVVVVIEVALALFAMVLVMQK